MLIESAMPTYDVVIAKHVIVTADPSTTFHAARTLNLLTVRTPLLAASIWLRALPARWVGRAAPVSRARSAVAPQSSRRRRRAVL
jgi:hypothetical protein